MRRRTTAILLALASFGLAAAVVAPLVGAAPSTKARKAAAKRPVITRVTPMRVGVGSRLVLRGRNFSAKRRRNTVIFRAPNGRSAFAKPRRASRRKLVVRVPAALARILSRKAIRFRLRVLVNRRFGRFTTRRLSPVVVPSGFDDGGPGGVDGGGGSGTTSSCLSGDFDGDLLSGSFEAQIGTDPCLRDTDGDGVEDGYEEQSAIDLNSYPATPPLPYPGKRPYPNALDPTDANTDYDGDGLELREESLLWLRFSADGVGRAGRPSTLANLLYSDGLQSSLDPAPPAPADARANWALDLDEDGFLSDDERDGDGDGLGNWDEADGQFTEAWWPAIHNGTDDPFESPYPGIDFLDNEDLPGRDAFADPDLDGDGVLDGADDHDHDGLSNQFEVRRPGDWFSDINPIPPEVGNYWAYTNPFNPCKPFDSDRCHEHPPPGYYDGDGAPPIGPDPPSGYPGSAPATPDG